MSGLVGGNFDRLQSVVGLGLCECKLLGADCFGEEPGGVEWFESLEGLQGGGLTVLGSVVQSGSAASLILLSRLFVRG